MPPNLWAGFENSASLKYCLFPPPPLYSHASCWEIIRRQVSLFDLMSFPSKDIIPSLESNNNRREGVWKSSCITNLCASYCVTCIFHLGETFRMQFGMNITPKRRMLQLKKRKVIGENRSRKEGDTQSAHGRRKKTDERREMR